MVNFKTYAKNTKAQEKISSISNETEGLENDDTLYMTNEYATHYFYNLTENFGVNIMGSCGYVALGMLLGYYDTYWNDNFIAEEFDQNAVLLTNSFTTNVSSPGGEREPNVLGQEYSDVQDYIQRVVNYSVNNNCNYNNYLHLNLIKMGLDEKYYGENGPSISDDLGLSEVAYIYDLTQKYLYRERSFTANDVKIEWDCVESMETAVNENTRIRMFVEDRVKQGIPVLISAAKFAHDNSTVLGRHAMIAYDYKYENNTNILYVHTGQIQKDSPVITHISLDDFGYDVLTSAIALQPLTEHVINGADCEVTNNYVYQNGSTTKTYCPCSNQTFYQGKVIFENINCFGSNAIITNGNSVINDSNPLVFNYGQAVSIANATAEIRNYGNGPVFIFLGWYTDKTFTNKVTQVLSIKPGDYKVYAKWRVDYKWISYNRTLNVTKAEINDNPYDQFTICSAGDLSKITQMGITKLTIEFYISIKEIRNGTQYLYFYGGTNGTTSLGSITFEATSEFKPYKVRFTIDLEKLKGNPVVYMKYKTSKSGFLNLVKDEWQSNQYFAEISFVVNESDITGDDALDFVWHYENSLARQMN